MIDEKKLIEWAELVRDDYKNCLGDYDSADVVQYIIDGIIKQPKVDEWIPCSERLPEESGDYLVTIYLPQHDRRFMTFKNFDGVRFITELVIAWMPLPEPYEEGEYENRK